MASCSISHPQIDLPSLMNMLCWTLSKRFRQHAKMLAGERSCESVDGVELRDIVVLMDVWIWSSGIAFAAGALIDLVEDEGSVSKYLREVSGGPEVLCCFAGGDRGGPAVAPPVPPSV